MLNAAGRVTILAGAGCAGAHEQLIALAGALQAPVVHAFRGKEFVEYDNPYDVGMTGLIGFSSGYRAMEHCDALVMLGTDFPYRPFFPEGVPVVQVDVRGERIGRRVPVQVPLVGTVKDTVDALLPLLTAKTDSAHLNRMTAHYRRARARLDKLARDRRNDSPLHPQYVAATIDRLAAADAIFTADVGTPCIWAARYLHMNGTRRLIGSFNHGSMANALPHAIGAQASHPGRQVIALSGDGGIAMLLGELITLRQQHLPVKIVVFNNGALSFVELEMKAAGIVTYGTDLDNPDFAAIARAAGLFGARVEQGRRAGRRAAGGVRPRRPGAGRGGHRPARAVPAAQAHLRRDQGLHPVRDQDHPVRRRGGARRAHQDQPARTRGRVTPSPPNAPEKPGRGRERPYWPPVLTLALLIILGLAGLRGAVTGPHWNGPLWRDRTAIGVALEVILGILLVITVRRRAAASPARRAAAGQAGPQNLVAVKLRAVLIFVLGAGMIAVAVAIVASLHLRVRVPQVSRPGSPLVTHTAKPAAGPPPGASVPLPADRGPVRLAHRGAGGRGAAQHLVGPAVRGFRPSPGAGDGFMAEDPEDLRAAVESGRSALRTVDEPRAAIIACYVAMERSLAERGAARAVADTPDELLARATSSGIVRGPAAGRLTALFYEARFSSHPLDGGQRDAAEQALDELAAALAGPSTARAAP